MEKRISTGQAFKALGANSKEGLFFLGRWFKAAGKGVAKATKEAAMYANKQEERLLPEHKEN